MKKIFLFILLLCSLSAFSQRHILVNGWKHTAVPVSILAFNTNSAATNNLTNTLTGVPAGSLLVLTLASSDDNVQFTSWTVTSSPSLTWVKRVDGFAASRGNTAIYTATYTSGGSITSTATNTGFAGFESGVLYSMAGADASVGGNTTSQTTGTTPNFSITTTRASSIIIMVSADWNAVSGTATYRDAATQVFRDFQSGAYTGYHYYKQATTVTSYTEGLSAPTGQAANSCALEIRGN